MCFSLYKELNKTKKDFFLSDFIYIYTLAIPLLYLVCIPKPYYIADVQNRKIQNKPRIRCIIFLRLVNKFSATS